MRQKRVEGSHWKTYAEFYGLIYLLMGCNMKGRAPMYVGSDADEIIGPNNLAPLGFAAVELPYP